MGEERARDLVAETLLICLRRKAAPADPGAYFWKVVEHRFNRRLREHKDRTEPLREEPLAGDPSPLEQPSENELQERIDEILRRLPEHQAEVARVHLIEGLSLAVTGRELGLATVERLMDGE